MIAQRSAIVRRERSCPGCGAKLFGAGEHCNRCQPAARSEREARRIPRERLGYAEPQPDPKRNRPHLDWISTQQCVVPGCMVRTCDPAHVRMNTGAGTGLKPADHWAIPCCHPHHMEQHRIGHRLFDAKYGIDSRALAETFAALSPHL